MRVLIVGAGIAGPTLAYWLLRAGHEPTLVERAPELRRGGYLIDFWGAGFDVAERMGIVPELVRRGYRAREVRQVKADGSRLTSLSPELFVGSVDRYVSLARSDLGRNKRHCCVLASRMRAGRRPRSSSRCRAPRRSTWTE